MSKYNDASFPEIGRALRRVHGQAQERGQKRATEYAVWKTLWQLRQRHQALGRKGLKRENAQTERSAWIAWTLERGRYGQPDEA